MSYHVLLVGGHGKVAQYLTPLLLKRSWTVTSVIRTHDQVPTIQKHGIDQPGKLNVLVYDVEKISSKRQAGDLLHELKPDYIVWSAGKCPVQVQMIEGNLQNSRIFNICTKGCDRCWR